MSLQDFRILVNVEFRFIVERSPDSDVYVVASVLVNPLDNFEQSYSFWRRRR